MKAEQIICFSFQLEFGVVYSCLEDKMYKARKGKGAFCDDEQIQVSDVKGNGFIYYIFYTLKHSIFNMQYLWSERHILYSSSHRSQSHVLLKMSYPPTGTPIMAHFKLFWHAAVTEIKKSIIISEHGTDRSPEKVTKIFSTMQKILCIPVHGWVHCIHLVYHFIVACIEFAESSG